MIPLRTQVLAGVVGEIGTVIARVTAHGRTEYMVRFQDGRVRPFDARWVREAVVWPVRVAFRPRLVAVDGARV